MALVRARFDTVFETDFGSITSAFTQIGGRAFPAAYRIAYVQNNTDQTMDFSISYEGETVCFSLVSGDKFSSDIFAAGGLSSAIGESAWVKYRTSAPTSGWVQFTGVLGV